MAKQSINVGTTANDKKGDSLRAAFQKVNANFTELYEAVGLADTGQDTALTFLGSTIGTDDSSSIVIDRSTTVTSNLSVGGDLLPQTANGGDLGSSTLPWRSLYVSNNTIYIGGTAVGIDANGQLTVSGSQVNAPSSTLVNGAYTVSLGSNGNLNAPGIVSAAGLRTSETKIALGSNAGQTSQGPLSVAIGYGAGAATQGLSSVAVGNLAGANTQGGLAVAVGNSAGQLNQGYEAVAVGFTTGLQDQGTWSVAIGSYAGAFSQGEDAIAIGRFAGQTNQPDNTIILNATGTEVNGVAAQTNSFYVAPIRNIGGTSGVLQYNAATKEVSYSSDITSESNINIEINLADSTLRRWQFGEDGNLTFPDGTNYSGSTITLPQTTNGIPNKVSWNFSDIAVGSTTTSLEWNLLSTTFSDFLIGTSSAATPFYFNFDGSGQTLGTIDNGGTFGGGKVIFGSTAGNNAGDANAIELKATNGDVYLTSTESVKITVDAADSSARVWTFDPSGNLNVPGGIVAALDEDLVINTSFTSMGSPPGPTSTAFTFGANGTLTVPNQILGTDDLTLRAADNYTTSIEAGVGGSIEIGYQGDPPANIYIGTATAGYTTSVKIQSDRLRISVDVPTSSKGQSGDVAGLVAFSSTHIYYCTASYDGTTDIWKRVALTGGAW